MLNYKFNIIDYNWEVEVYYHITHYEIDTIVSKLKELACKGNELISAKRSLISNSLNTGMIYSNYNKRSSIIIVVNTSTPAEFLNSVTHEVYHLVSHICDADVIDRRSEEAAYLMGDVIRTMYVYSKQFLCNHYETKRYINSRNIHKYGNDDYEYNNIK